MSCRTWMIAAATLTLLACSRATEPGPELLVSEIQTSLNASATAVTPGDTIEFTSTAFNPTGERVQIGVECGPAFDVVVTSPRGVRTSVLRASLGSHGAFTCELGPYHFAEPGEREMLRLRWQVPAARGTYRAVTGLRRASGLVQRSAPVTFIVR